MVLISEWALDLMIDKLNLELNNELDIISRENKNLKSIRIKRVGKNWKIECWHRDQFKK